MIGARQRPAPKRRPRMIGHPVGPPPEHLLKSKGTEKEGKGTDKGMISHPVGPPPEHCRRGPVPRGRGRAAAAGAGYVIGARQQPAPKRRPCMSSHPVGPPPEHLLSTEKGKDTDKEKGTAKRRPHWVWCHPVGPPPEHLLKGKGTEEGKDTDKGKGTDKGKDMPESLRRKGKGTDKGMGKRRFFWSGNDD